MTQGLNPKRWLYDFAHKLDQDAARQVLAGCAAERWLAGELYRHISRTLPPTLTAYPETCRWKDIAVFRVREGRPAWKEDPLAFVELKLVYLNDPPSRRRQKLQSLAWQVADGGSQGVRTVGWLIAIHAHWGSPKEDFGQFKREVVGLSDGTLSRRGLKLAKRSLETLIAPGVAQVGGVDVPVAAAHQYIDCRPSSP